MSAHESTKPHSAALSRTGRLLTWLGGGHWRELGERYERSAHAVSGAVVLFGALLAWLVATGAVTQSARWPVLAVAPFTLVFALLVGAVTRGIAGGPNRGRAGAAGRAAVAVAVGGVVGELAALVLLSSPIEHRLDDRAVRNADSAPAVALASAALQQTTNARHALDDAVEQARAHQDNALVVARCEYNPTPGCPPTRITGVPGAGPETRTANELLADAQRELDNALAARDSQAPGLDAEISREQQGLTEARQGVVAGAGGGLGARWVAMNDLTVTSTGAFTLRVLTVAFFVLVYLLPLILGLWRGETTHDRRAQARAQRERAELDADTAIAMKRAEVRREAEMLWAEHQLTQARLAIEAQREIDREQQRRRVLDAFGESDGARPVEPVQDDMYLPIAAEAEAASRAIAQAAVAPAEAPVETPESSGNLPEQIRPAAAVERHTAPLIPSIPDATKAAARWIRPLVPPFVARVIDNTTAPLRTARQVFEEVEEITFSLRRTRKVTLDSESTGTGPPRPSARAETPPPTEWMASSRGEDSQFSPFDAVPTAETGGRTLPGSARGHRIELVEREGRPALRPPDGPPQLPPAQ